MRRTMICVCWVLALMSCRAHRVAQSTEESAVNVSRTVSFRKDSLTLLAVAELEGVQLAMYRDSSVDAVATAASARIRVMGDVRAVAAKVETDSVAESTVDEKTESHVKAERPSVWPLAVVGLLALILLSWTGIRFRR